MRKFILISISALLLFTACTAVPDNRSLPSPTSFTDTESLAPDTAYRPLNFAAPVGMWFPYMYYEDYLAGKSEEEFRSAVRERYSAAKAQGVNTVYLHVRPNGDAYYDSRLFPKGSLWSGEYDALSVMLDEAHSLGLSAHAWINPLRLQTPEQMDTVSSEFRTKQWYEAKNGMVKEVSGRLWLDPSYAEVRELIEEGVREIAENYDIDGIHIDDYFYPTTDTAFDAYEFEQSGASDLAQWRTDNINALVKSIYTAVKGVDDRLLFGISPQGNIDSDYSTQYADVRLWAGTTGYCDYIVPQLYFGFKNECCPFAETLAEWESITGGDVTLVIGLAPYKLGKVDKWAGEGGQQEWIDDPGIIEKQIEAITASSADGYALYY